MFFGNEEKKSEELFRRKESKRKNNIFLWLRERVRQSAKNFLRVAQIIGRRRDFKKFSTIFYNFLQFFGKFLENFYNFLENFCDFSEIFYNFSAIFRKFFRKFSPTIRCGSTKSRHYCKFTIKFTTKFTLILIKILQSTKFEGSTFTTL